MVAHPNFNPPMSDTACYRILVAIETDATRYHGASAGRPALLGPSDTEQLLAHFAADLADLIPGTTGCRLAAPGALLDQTQILRPGYPAFRALEERLMRQRSGHAAVAATDGRIEPEALHPSPEIPLGILQLLPVVISGQADTVEGIGREMEHRFLEQGQVSAHTAQWLDSAFRIASRHARFMTLTDLNAMFRLQLEHFGFLSLWQLIDAALEGRPEPLQVSATDGHVFTWKDGAVNTDFETFDYWASVGLGRRVEGARGKLAGGYADWTRQLRQYLTTLEAHTIPVRLSLARDNGRILEGNHFTERSEHPPPAHSAVITEHSFAELGTVCVTTVRGGAQYHHYPLRPTGLNDIQQAVRNDALGDGVVAYPGSILYDAGLRALIPERVDSHSARIPR